MKQQDKIFLYWMLSLSVCFAIESFAQQEFGIIGLGIISAIFMSVMFIHDILLLFLKERNLK